MFLFHISASSHHNILKFHISENYNQGEKEKSIQYPTLGVGPINLPLSVILSVCLRGVFWPFLLSDHKDFHKFLHECRRQ